MKRGNFATTKTGLILLVIWLFTASTTVLGDVTLPHIFGSSMVMQRDMVLPVWGWAEAGEEVTVEFAGQKVQSKADANGNWQVKLAAMKAGGPYEMAINGKNRINLKDILIGEVWVCSGQSNMAMGVGAALNGKQEMADANYPQIRLFQVPNRTAGQPIQDVDGIWRVCNPEGITHGNWEGFSAAAYYFGREINKKLNIPVGLIHTSWGGTRIEPWTPAAGFEMVPTLQKIYQEIQWYDGEYKKAVEQAIVQFGGWIPAARKALEKGTPIPVPPVRPEHNMNSYEKPTGLYNAMIAPFVPFAIRGAIWYQGESNSLTRDGITYFDKMKALIGGWRKVWNEGDFPFYFVQIAPFRYDKAWKDMGPYAEPEIWEAQMASLSIPNTGIAGTMDISDLDNIHPANKQDVGKRLALWALAKDYGLKDTVYSGPIYKTMSVEGNKIRISFYHAESGLASRDAKPLTWFEISGADKNFVKAEAKIDGNTVLVWSEQVKEPVAVRFGWNELAEPNLMNKEGLPALPFRTHQW